MSTLTAHAADRVADRLREGGLDPAKVAAKADEVARSTSPYWRSCAVLLATLRDTAGDQRDDVLTRGSNGNEVWTVIRDGRVITVMFRRSDQPKRPDCFAVEKVLQVKP